MKRAEAKLAQKERELKADIWMLDRLLKTGQELIQKRIYLQNFRYSGIVNEHETALKASVVRSCLDFMFVLKARMI